MFIEIGNFYTLNILTKHTSIAYLVFAYCHYLLVKSSLFRVFYTNPNELVFKILLRNDVQCNIWHLQWSEN